MQALEIVKVLFKKPDSGLNMRQKVNLNGKIEVPRLSDKN